MTFLWANFTPNFIGSTEFILQSRAHGEATNHQSEPARSWHNEWRVVWHWCQCVAVFSVAVKVVRTAPAESACAWFHFFRRNWSPWRHFTSLRTEDLFAGLGLKASGQVASSIREGLFVRWRCQFVLSFPSSSFILLVRVRRTPRTEGKQEKKTREKLVELNCVTRYFYLQTHLTWRDVI